MDFRRNDPKCSRQITLQEYLKASRETPHLENYTLQGERDFFVEQCNITSKRNFLIRISIFYSLYNKFSRYHKRD